MFNSLKLNFLILFMFFSPVDAIGPIFIIKIFFLNVYPYFSAISA